MLSSSPPLHPAPPKPPPAHFLRPRQGFSNNPKCFCCSNSCVTKCHVETEPAAPPPPSITPADPRQSLKFKIRLKKKGDNAVECPDQSKQSEIGIIKPTCSSDNAEAKDSLKIRLKKKKGDNAAECPDQSKPSKIRIIKFICSSANAAAATTAKDCSNSIPAKISISEPGSAADAPAMGCLKTTPSTEVLRITENRKRKSAGAEKRPEFSLSLSKQEIEEDFLAMTGAKPPRRPTKRPKHVQEQLNHLFPGMYLSKRVTEARYKVRR